MASKTKATPQKEEAPEKETSDSPDSPLLDLSDAAVRKMIKLAKKRGWVTHDQINAVLPSEEVSPITAFGRELVLWRIAGEHHLGAQAIPAPARAGTERATDHRVPQVGSAVLRRSVRTRDTSTRGLRLASVRARRGRW